MPLLGISFELGISLILLFSNKTFSAEYSCFDNLVCELQNVLFYFLFVCFSFIKVINFIFSKLFTEYLIKHFAA